MKSMTRLAKGNIALRDGDYLTALRHYDEALKQTPELGKIINENINLANKKKKEAIKKDKQAEIKLDSLDQFCLKTETDVLQIKTAVVVHYYYPEIWLEIKEKLYNLPEVYDLFITVPNEKAANAAVDILPHFANARIYTAENRGMDIVPFLSLIPILANEGYKIVCKIQTKKGDGHLASVWRNVMLDSLIGSEHNFTGAIKAFDTNKNLCMIGPAALYLSAHRLMYDNKHNISTIWEATYNAKLQENDWGFFAGTMFWSKIEILKKLAEHMNLSNPALDGEYKKDGKIEHALERLFGAMASMNGGEIGLLNPVDGDMHKLCEITTVKSGVSIGLAHVGDVVRQIDTFQQDKIDLEKGEYFSFDYYLKMTPEIKGKNIDLAYHYLTQGRFRGVLPSQSAVSHAEIASYLSEKGDARSVYKFIADNNGDASIIAASVFADRREAVFDKELICSSGLFDFDYYRQQCHDMQKSDEEILDHYHKIGTYNELYPNRWFIPREYRALNKDVVDAGVEAFHHYVTKGALEGRRYRSSKWREEEESPFLRFMVLNEILIDWKKLRERSVVKGMVSIVIPIYGQLEYTKQCIDSILSSSSQTEYEIICVDNGSDSAVQDELAAWSYNKEKIVHIRNNENYNFALGCNIGFKSAVGEYIVFLNNDTVVTGSWLDEIIKPMCDHAIVAVQPKLIYPDNTVQNVGVVFAPKQTLGYPIYAGFDPSATCVNIPRNFQALTAACIAVRSRDFASVKGFDPMYINGQEDVDLCLRLVSDGDRVCRYQPTASVLHYESKTPGRGKYIKLNRKNFTDRWKNKVQPDDFKYYNDDNFRIVNWLRDSQEMIKDGIGISRPVLEKIESKVCRLRYFFDTRAHYEAERLLTHAYNLSPATIDNELISVIMPTFNRGHVICRSIDSVLAQSHQNFELIICDDGSIDDTMILIDKYKNDDRVKVIRLDHGGVSAARNIGLDNARGDLIAYLDSDNCWYEHFLRYMVTYIRKGDLNAAYCTIQVTNDDGAVVCFRGDNFHWDECLQENYIDINAFVHIRTNFRFDLTLKRLVDWDFILRFTSDARVAYIPYLGVNYYDGDQISRITHSEYKGDKLNEMQKYIRLKNSSSSSVPVVRPSLILNFDATLTSDFKFFDVNVASHAEGLFNSHKLPLHFRIKIGCPSLAVSHEWGDYHFANAMKRSLERFGHQCAVDCLDEWDSTESLKAHVVIVLRGLSRYKPKRGQINLMWNISHPDKIGLDEYAEYDHVFIASIPYAKLLQKKLTVPVSVLLQCTDPELFNPSVPMKPRHEVLFVGNSRNVFRKIVRDAIQADLPLSVFGTRWEQFIAKQYIAGNHINNEELAGYYANAGIVLNDHWDTMRDYGFLSNRLFDAAACAALVVTDDIEGLRDVFDDTILTYHSPETLRAIYFGLLKQDVSADRISLANKIICHHSFDARVQSILSCVNDLLTCKESVYA